MNADTLKILLMNGCYMLKNNIYIYIYIYVFLLTVNTGCPVFYYLQ